VAPSFAKVQWVINAYLLIIIRGREIAPMRAAAPANTLQTDRLPRPALTGQPRALSKSEREAR